MRQIPKKIEEAVRRGRNRLGRVDNFLLLVQLTWPSLSLITRRTGVSWPCMALYSVLMLMPCFEVPNASVQGYPMVRGGRFLASCLQRRMGFEHKTIKESRGEKRKGKKSHWSTEKVTTSNAQLHVQWHFNALWCLKKSNGLKTWRWATRGKGVCGACCRQTKGLTAAVWAGRWSPQTWWENSSVHT